MSITRTLFFLLLLLQVIIIVLLLSGYHIVDPALYNRVRSTGSAETLDVAAQLGRFDLISMFLGIIAVLIGVMAVSGFWMIRREAVKAAEDIANAQAPQTAQKTAQAYVAENLPKMVESMIKPLLPTTPNSAPEIGLSAEQVREVTSGAEEIGPEKRG